VLSDQDMRATWAAPLAVGAERQCVVPFTGFSENKILTQQCIRRRQVQELRPC
jgi:hypothetical protein